MINYEQAVEMVEKAKPQGKSIVSIEEDFYEVDRNFIPPKTRKIKIELDKEAE